MMNCKDCHYQEEGSCRRYPPNPTVLMVPDVDLLTQKTTLKPATFASFPTVMDDHWCGEFKTKPKSFAISGV